MLDISLYTHSGVFVKPLLGNAKAALELSLQNRS